MQHLLCGELEFLQYICGVGAGPGGGIVLRYTTYTLGLGDPREVVSSRDRACSLGVRETSSVLSTDSYAIYRQ